MPKRAKSTADDFLATLDGEFRDLEGENELLRRELRRVLALKGETKKPNWKPRYRLSKGKTRRHFVIGDCQCKPGQDLSFLTWIGKYIADKAQPGDVVVNLGDMGDFESLGVYDRGKLAFEGRRYKADVDAHNEGIERLDAELDGLGLEKHLTEGNHEYRILRAVEEYPWLDGWVGLQNLNRDNWIVHPFLKPVNIDGILYAHFFANPLSGKPIGGSAQNVMNRVKAPFVMGHRQVLESCCVEVPCDGGSKLMRGLILGAAYPWYERYKGPQGNGHFRGIAVLHEVNDGMYNLMEVSIGFLRDRYGR